MAWETSDLNVATFFTAVKKIPTAGHRYKGRQLLISFDMDKDQAQTYIHEYLNSVYAEYDAKKRNFIQLLKFAPAY